MTRKSYYSGPLASGVKCAGLTSNAYGLAKLDAGILAEDVLPGLLSYCFGPYTTKRKAYQVARYQGASGAVLEFSFKTEG